MAARTLVQVLLCAALLAACDRGAGFKAPVDTAKVIDSIKADEVRWNADWRAGDGARLAAHYAADAVLMSPGAPTLSGSEAIRSAVTEAVSQPGFSLTFASDSVIVGAAGDLAVAHGTYRQTHADPHGGAPITETGSYVTTYKPGPDGVWKAVWDINTPGAAAPAAKP
jgi:uncharacterized protein (TIGR02246 family)